MIIKNKVNSSNITEENIKNFIGHINKQIFKGNYKLVIELTIKEGNKMCISYLSIVSDHYGDFYGLVDIMTQKSVLITLDGIDYFLDGVEAELIKLYKNKSLLSCKLKSSEKYILDTNDAVSIIEC